MSSNEFYICHPYVRELQKKKPFYFDDEFNDESNESIIVAGQAESPNFFCLFISVYRVSFRS